MPLGSLVYAVTGNWDHMIHGTTSSNIQPFFCGGRGSIFFKIAYVYIYIYIFTYDSTTNMFFVGFSVVPELPNRPIFQGFLLHPTSGVDAQG